MNTTTTILFSNSQKIAKLLSSMRWLKLFLLSLVCLDDMIVGYVADVVVYIVVYYRYIKTASLVATLLLESALPFRLIFLAFTRVNI